MTEVRQNAQPGETGCEERYQTEWEGLRLVVEERSGHWQAFVYDPEQCEVLYTAAQPELPQAKTAALEFAANQSFGPKHGLNVEILLRMLIWDEC